MKKNLTLTVDNIDNQIHDYLTISSAKPPIFWKDKEITKQQIFKWKPNNIKNFIFLIDKIELMVKKNYENSVNLVTDFILEQCSSRN